MPTNSSPPPVRRVDPTAPVSLRQGSGPAQGPWRAIDRAPKQRRRAWICPRHGPRQAPCLRRRTGTFVAGGTVSQCAEAGLPRRRSRSLIARSAAAAGVSDPNTEMTPVRSRNWRWGLAVVRLATRSPPVRLAPILVRVRSCRSPIARSVCSPGVRPRACAALRRRRRSPRPRS